MPEDLVAAFLSDGRLVTLRIEEEPAASAGTLTLYAAHMRTRPLGRAGRWLLNDLQTRFGSSLSMNVPPGGQHSGLPSSP